jgi:hypothetical protein
MKEGYRPILQITITKYSIVGRDLRITTSERMLFTFRGALGEGKSLITGYSWDEIFVQE